jgi:hypothetical protein
VDGTLVIGHQAYPHIGMRYRGRASIDHPKRPRKFRFDTVPVVTPAGGACPGPVEVAIAAPSGWDVYVTLDGSDPRLSPTRRTYDGALTLTATTEPQAAAAEAGHPLAEGRWTDRVRHRFGLP